ncbi:uncharacterized protein [Aristolochia californica]|uniref:uncharacterized protein n=1 Tax=Aristolochia californica TaxID=171875 RepID=UPI0035DF94E4
MGSSPSTSSTTVATTALDLDSFCQDNDIIHQTSCAYTPQPNGVTERTDHHILEVAHGLLYAMKVSYFYWPHAILTTCFLINWLSSSVLGNESPYSLLLPNDDFFFTTLENVTFFEDSPYYTDNASLVLSSLQGSPRLVVSRATETTQPLETLVDTTPTTFTDPTEASPSCSVIFFPQYDTRPIAIRKEPRSCTMPSTSHPISNFVSHHILSLVCCQFLSVISSISIPRSYHEALKHPGWKAKMDEEMQVLYENQTWALVLLPSEKKLIG